MLLSLGANKQLDVQSMLIHAAKCVAMGGNWYAERRHIQFEFVVGVVIIAIVMIALGCLLFRAIFKYCWPALLGMGLLVSFIVFRAALFNHVEPPIISDIASAVLEIVGILAIAINVFLV